MKIVLCDDDGLFILTLKEQLQLFFRQNHLPLPEIISFTNGEDLLSYPGDIDILFLDIEMPGINGIAVGEALKKRSSKTIIFIVTSYSEYLDDAMRFHVFRYLSKPLDMQRLFRNLKDALALYHSVSENIIVETRQEIVKLPVNDIIAVEAQGRRVTVHTAKKDYESVHGMRYWVEKLPKNCFLQSHRSFIVNLRHVNNFSHDLISLADGRFSAYLTKRKFTEFKNAYLLYLESGE